jgi:hypothetical protein
MSSRPALGPTQPPIQCVLRALSPGVKLPGRETDHSPPTSVEVKKCGSIQPLPHTPIYIQISGRAVLLSLFSHSGHWCRWFCSSSLLACSHESFTFALTTTTTTAMFILCNGISFCLVSSLTISLRSVSSSPLSSSYSSSGFPFTNSSLQVSISHNCIHFPQTGLVISNCPVIPSFLIRCGLPLSRRLLHSIVVTFVFWVFDVREQIDISLNRLSA